MYVLVCLLVSLLNIILLVLVGKISCFEMKHIYGSVEVIQEFKKKDLYTHFNISDFDKAHFEHISYTLICMKF